MTTTEGTPSGAAEVSAAVAAAVEMARVNQATATSEPGAKDTNGTGNPDIDTANTYTNKCSVCFNFDVTTGPTQLEEAT